MKYTRSLTNTGMADQPTWVFDTLEPDGKLGSHVGDYCAISADKQRFYRITPYMVEHMGFCYYPGEGEESMDELTECGFDKDMLCQQFVCECEELFSRGTYVNVWVKDIVDNMIAMSERLHLGWVCEEIEDNYEEGWRIYSKTFAEKAYIGQNAIFCYSAESLVETIGEFVKDNVSVASDYKMHDVIMMYPDGSYDEDEAYVVVMLDVDWEGGVEYDKVL